MLEAGAKLTDNRVDDLAPHKAKAPYGQAPMYEDAKVGVIAQTNAILRYVGATHGLYSTNPVEAAHIDHIVDGTDDLRSRRRDAKTDEEKKKWNEEGSKFWLGAIAKQLKGDFFVGGKLTIADLAVFNVVDSFALDPSQKSQLDAFPTLVAHHARVAARPNIAKWLAARPKTEW